MSARTGLVVAALLTLIAIGAVYCDVHGSAQAGIVSGAIALEADAAIDSVAGSDLERAVYAVHSAGQPCGKVSAAHWWGSEFELSCDGYANEYSITVVNGVAFVADTDGR